jgi:hypothetical protein
MTEPSRPPFPEPIVIRNAKGLAIVRVSLIFTLYFPDGFDFDVRARISACFEEYRTRFAPHLKWLLLPDAERWHRAEPERIRSLHDWMRSGKAEIDYFLALRGGKNPHEASDYVFKVIGDGLPFPQVSYLQIVLPASDPTVTLQTFRELSLRLTQIIKPHSGYGGLGFAEGSDVGIMDEGAPTIYALAQRFPGIEVERPVDHIFYVGKGIKGVNWLTVLGQHWLDAMGGVTKLRAMLSDAFIFYPYDGGLVIQAGPVPQPGDVNQRNWPYLYAELARVLKPVRLTVHDSFDGGNPNRFTKESTLKWLNRFDEDPPFGPTH